MSDFELMLFDGVYHAVQVCGMVVVGSAALYAAIWIWIKTMDKLSDALGLTRMMIKLIDASYKDRKAIKR